MNHTTKQKTDFFKYKNTPNIRACNLAQKSRADQAYSKEYIRFTSFIEDHPYLMMTVEDFLLSFAKPSSLAEYYAKLGI